LPKNYLKIGFIGAGSIGSLFGGYLGTIGSEDYSIEIIFFGLKEHIDEIKRNGLKIHKEQKVTIVKNIRAYENLETFNLVLEKNKNYQFDFMFLTTKTYDTGTALEQYKNLIDLSKRIVILQNGIGNEEVVKSYCPTEKIIRIVTSHGALLKEPGHVYHTGEGFIKVGLAFSNKVPSDLILFRDLLNWSGLEAEIVEDIIQSSWEKIFVNIGINALGALTRLHNGGLLENEGLKHMMKGAVEEALKIARLKGIKLPDKDYLKLTYSVAEKTYNNQNSMLQDVLKGQVTEIDSINGKIVKYAEELGISVPINELLTNLIKGLEKSYL